MTTAVRVFSFQAVVIPEDVVFSGSFQVQGDLLSEICAFFFKELKGVCVLDL